MKPIPTDRTITYQLQYRTCRRPRCHCRVAGTRHGPYWYAYWRDHTGKVRSAYIGKNLPSASREGNVISPTLTQKQTGIASRESDARSLPADRSSCLSEKTTQARIVVRENNSALHDLLVWALTLAGYSVVVPNSPQSRSPDLLLLDVGLGDPKEAEELLRLQHALLPEHPRPPIIVLTTNPDLQVTGCSLLLKPFHLCTLYDLVALHLELARYPADRDRSNTCTTRSLKQGEREEEVSRLEKPR